MIDQNHLKIGLVSEDVGSILLLKLDAVNQGVLAKAVSRFC